MIINAKDFSKREELENEVRHEFGLTPEKKEATIEGTRKELARLQLDDTTTFWGIECKITDTPTELETPKERVDRGQVHKFGININNL